jgi:hypothetical protein
VKKRYKLEYSGAFPMIVEVDDEKFTEQHLKDWNEFWSNHEVRSAHKSGSALVPMLEMAYLLALQNSVTYWNARERLIKGEDEGHQPFDGSCGITLISMEDWEFDDSEVSCSEEDVPA